MNIPARKDNFELLLPISLIPPVIKEKYKAYLERMESTITDAHQYVSSTIQMVNSPGLKYDPAVQNQRGQDVGFRASVPYNNLFDKSLEISFQMVDGMINYFIMFETFLYHYAFNNGTLHIDPIRIYFIDSDGVRLSSILYEQILFIGMDALEADHTNNNTEPFQFTASFTFNKISFELLDETVLDGNDQTTLDYMYENNFSLNITSEIQDIDDDDVYKEFTYHLMNTKNCRANLLTNENVSVNIVRGSELLCSIYGPANETISSDDVELAKEHNIYINPVTTYGNITGTFKETFKLEITVLDICGNKRQIVTFNYA